MAKVLVIEDNPQNLMLAQLVLEKAGHTVLSAVDGAQGLELARQVRPDLVVLDIQMPGLDGLSVTRLLKQSPLTEGVKVLALTALAMKGDRERILAAGCDDYVAKPFSHIDLIDRISRLLG
jgi:two-component system cell cycle response regulator DivK